MLDKPPTDADFYGDDMKLCLIGFLRDEKKFSGFDELITQIMLDISMTRNLTNEVNQSKQPYVKKGRQLAEEFFSRKNDVGITIWERAPLL